MNNHDDLKPIPDIPAHFVAPDGRIWRVRNGVRRELSRPVNASGMLTVQLPTREGFKLTRTVSRLVGAAFCPDYVPNGVYAEFQDGNRHNCAASNLKWFTRGELIIRRENLPAPAAESIGIPPKPIEKSNGYMVHAEGYITRNGFNVLARPTAYGAMSVRVSMQGGYADTVMVGRAVGKAFDPNYRDHLRLQHKDGDRTNCALSNLEWVTRTSTGSPGAARRTAKLKDDDVLAIRASDERPYLLAARYGVSKTHINHIKSRRTWKHI